MSSKLLYLGTVKAILIRSLALSSYMMNDLDVASGTSLWKYVDDSTMSETVNKDQSSAMQTYVNEFAAKSRIDGMHLKELKCKELRISFSTTNVEFEPIIINN